MTGLATNETCQPRHNTNAHVQSLWRGQNSMPGMLNILCRSHIPMNGTVSQSKSSSTN
ncbi:rCG34952 [Rattus norvegicus]|uniref:RCG34952 n=1 Tax=Rattus norvegicus TaxID=10116 RepID=A6HDG7_RAT|nr:rCG34952 [Rattus norvegicus]